MLKEKILKTYTKFKQAIPALALIFGLFVLLLLSQFIYDSFFYSDESSYSDDYSYEGCNVMGVELRGELYTYVPRDAEGNKLEGYEDTTTSEDVLSLLDDAQFTDSIKGVLIEVDSYGGSSAPAEEISNYIKNMNKPVVSFIRGAGASAAYGSIVPSDYIFALKSSDVGSIGVTMSYLDNVSKNQQEGYSFIQLSTGKFKDAGTPDRPITQEERNLFMRDLKIIHENFIQTVSENRNIVIEKVREIADGSTVLGERAKELGLIDEIGDYSDATDYLGGLIDEDVSVCW